MHCHRPLHRMLTREVIQARTKGPRMTAKLQQTLSYPLRWGAAQ